MKVYVASRFSPEGIAATREMHRTLRAAGHEITHDWTQESADGKSGEELKNYLTECAEKDLDAVLACDALVFISIDNTRLRGAYVEAGIALGLGRRVIVLDAHPGTLDMPSSCIFFMLRQVELAFTHDEVVRRLAGVPF